MKSHELVQEDESSPLLLFEREQLFQIRDIDQMRQIEQEQDIEHAQNRPHGHRTVRDLDQILVSPYGFNPDGAAVRRVRTVLSKERSIAPMPIFRLELFATSARHLRRLPFVEVEKVVGRHSAARSTVNPLHDFWVRNSRTRAVS